MARQRYHVTEKIDMGGMAEIYRGRATSLEGIEKEVAIKRVLPQLTRNKKFIGMFLDEARLSMHLNHANIVQVFDVGRADNTYFIVMEFVDGYNVRKIFQQANLKNAPIPIELAVYILMQVCNGLAHAHEKKDGDGELLQIVHRDVSPPNVLVSRQGEVKITDFGLAKAVSQMEITDPGIVKGKFSYLAPETAGGQEVDHRADIFAVGIILFELLTNRRLFLGNTDADTVELVEKAEIPNITRLNPDVPRGLQEILEQALAKNPKRRFPSARALSERLAEWLSGENLVVTPYTLSAYLERLFSNDAKEDPHERIDTMIAEEILNLSMLGMGPERYGQEGSRPIDLSALNLGSRGAGSLPMEQIWPVQDDENSDESGLGQLSIKTPSVDYQEKGQWNPLWIGLLLLLSGVLAFGAVYWHQQGG